MSQAPVGDGFWDRREGQKSWWERREDESETQWKTRMQEARFQAFDPDNPDLPID